MALFSRGWRLVSLLAITLSSGFLTVDIEDTVRARRPHPNPDPHPAPNSNPNPSR